MTTRRRTITTSIAAVLIGLAGAAQAVDATAAKTAPDTTPPTIHLEPLARATVGTQIATGYSDDVFYWQARFTLRWRASDPSGICGQTLAWSGYAEHWGQDDPILGSAEHIPLSPKARSYSTAATLNTFDYGRIADRWVIHVTDCAGNTSSSKIATVAFDTREDNAAGTRYHRRWRTLTGDHSGGTIHSTGARKAAVTTRFPGGGPVALVMTTGPRNGKADVYVDGRHRGVVDTRTTGNPQTRNRKVVWTGWFAPGRHTLKVVNRATRGRQYIGFDTLVTCHSRPDARYCHQQ
jgi:hypothetical protein